MPVNNYTPASLYMYMYIDSGTHHKGKLKRFLLKSKGCRDEELYTGPQRKPTKK